jgi:hypothetical protein
MNMEVGKAVGWGKGERERAGQRKRVSIMKSNAN